MNLRRGAAFINTHASFSNFARSKRTRNSSLSQVLAQDSHLVRLTVCANNTRCISQTQHLIYSLLIDYLNCSQLRGMQGILQKDRTKGPVVRVSRGKELHNRQKTKKQMPVLQIPEMPHHGHEKGGRARRTATDEGSGHVGGGVHLQHANGHADRTAPRSRKTGRVQRSDRTVRGTKHFTENNKIYSRS